MARYYTPTDSFGFHGIIVVVFSKEDLGPGAIIQRSPNGVTGWEDVAFLPSVAQNGNHFVDRLPNDEVTRFYRARHVWDAGEPGPWTNVVAGQPIWLDPKLDLDSKPWPTSVPLNVRIEIDQEGSGSLFVDGSFRTKSIRWATNVDSSTLPTVASGTVYNLTGSVDPVDDDGELLGITTVLTGDVLQDGELLRAGVQFFTQPDAEGRLLGTHYDLMRFVAPSGSDTPKFEPDFTVRLEYFEDSGPQVLVIMDVSDPYDRLDRVEYFWDGGPVNSLPPLSAYDPWSPNTTGTYSGSYTQSIALNEKHLALLALAGYWEDVDETERLFQKVLWLDVGDEANIIGVDISYDGTTAIVGVVGDADTRELRAQEFTGSSWGPVVDPIDGPFFEDERFSTTRSGSFSIVTSPDTIRRLRVWGRNASDVDGPKREVLVNTVEPLPAVTLGEIRLIPVTPAAFISPSDLEKPAYFINVRAEYDYSKVQNVVMYTKYSSLSVPSGSSWVSGSGTVVTSHALPAPASGTLGSTELNIVGGSYVEGPDIPYFHSNEVLEEVRVRFVEETALGTRLRDTTALFNEVVSALSPNQQTFILPSGDYFVAPAISIGSGLSLSAGGVLTASGSIGGGDVPSTRQINTTGGLTGGGDLSADRTLSLFGQAASVHNMSTNGFFVRNSSVTVVARSITAGTGITVSNGDGVANNPSIGLTGQALSLHNLSTNGLVARTSAGNVAGRTLTAGTGISITNGNGVSGNPTIAINTANVVDTSTSQNIGGVKTFTGNIALGSLSSTKVAGYLYSGSVNPTNTARVNYDGHFYATQLHSGGSFIFSSRELKDDIAPWSGSVFLNALRPSQWLWKHSGDRDYGFIAQEVPYVFQGPDNTVNYNRIVAALVDEVKALKAEIEELRNDMGK